VFINITIEIGEQRRDILIDSEQKISEGLLVLRQSGKLPMGFSPDYFRSMQNKRLVSAYKTFVDEGVFDGDILSAI